jgi:hypothetical protein
MIPRSLISNRDLKLLIHALKFVLVHPVIPPGF